MDYATEADATVMLEDVPQDIVIKTLKVWCVCVSVLVVSLVGANLFVHLSMLARTHSLSPGSTHCETYTLNIITHNNC